MYEMYLLVHCVKQRMGILLHMIKNIYENASAVSLTLPLTKEMYNSKTLFPFFDGLIPEGWLLGVVSRNWKINVSDRFGLLLVACKDAIGNVSIREVRE